MPRRLVALLMLPPLLVCGGCWRLQLVPPALLSRTSSAPKVRAPRPAPTGSSRLYGGGIALGHLRLQSKTAPPSAAEETDFRHALSRTLALAFPRTDRTRSPLLVDVRYQYRTEARRSLVLDVFHTITLGLFFVTREKGAAIVDVDLSVYAPRSAPGDARGYRTTLRVRAPYKSYFTPWYDKSTRQQYLDYAHQVAFGKIVAHLRWWLRRGIVVRRSPTAQPVAKPAAEPPAKAPVKTLRKAVRPAPARRLAWHDLKLHVEGRSKAVRRRWKGHTIVGRERVKVKPRRSAFAKVLKLLGGLSVGYSYGSVWARSNVREANGNRYQIASGQGTSHSVGVSLFQPPANSGVYFSPTVGFLWERFSIADVAGLARQNSPYGATDIPAIATDPDQPGRPVIDLAAPWRYRLIMTSLYMGLRAGGVMVWGRKTQFFLGLEGGANLVEWRYMDVLWDNYRDRSHAFAGAGSFAGRLMTGLTIRPWHLTLFAQAGYEYFREFSYPEPIPFRGRMAYDQTLGVWQRPVQTAEALSLHALRVYIGVAVVY